MKLKRVAMLGLVALTIAQLASFPVLAMETAGAGYVEYNRSITIDPVMNRNTYQNTSFLNQWVGANNSSIYNIGWAFRKESGSKGASSMPNSLSFGTTFTHKNDDQTYQVYYEYDIESALRPAAQKGDLHICFAANLTNDKHWNALRHTKTWTAYPTSWLSSYTKNLIVHETKDYSRDGTWNMGKNQFVPIGVPYNNKLYFGAHGNICTCGSSKVSNIGIMLADVVGPKVTSIYATSLIDGDVERHPQFKGGDTFYIHLKFDEQIRFAGDETMTLANAPKLRLQLRRSSENIVETGFSAEASLVGLNYDTLTFRYVVPTDIAIDHYLDAVEPYLNQTTWVTSSNTFDLKLFGYSPSGVATYLSSAQKTSSLIVDLAGNPIETGGSTRTLLRTAYLDSTPPTVTKMDISRPFRASTSGQIDRSEVFAGIGETIWLAGSFSEPIYMWRESDANRFAINPSDLRAELNMLDGEGNPLIAVGREVINQEWDGNRFFAKVEFELTDSISADMVPLIYDAVQLPIGINRIYLEKDGYVLADALGNPYDTGRTFINAPAGERLMPTRQLWLDNVPPEVTTPLNLTDGEDGKVYEPYTYGGGDLSAFYFPIEVSDRVGHGEEYMSLTNGCTGYFMWRDGSEAGYSAFEYAVTGDATKPADNAYRQGTTWQQYPFIQLDSGNYIHIRLPAGVELRGVGSQLYVWPSDNAGNGKIHTTSPVIFPIEFVLDRVGPEITLDRVTKTFVNVAEGGRLEAHLTVQDASGIQSIAYQWRGRNVVIGVWIPVTDYDDDHSFSVEKWVDVGSRDYLPILHIRATDVANNFSTASFDLQYDLSRALYDIDFVTDPSVPSTRPTIILSNPSGGTSENAAQKIWVFVYRDNGGYVTTSDGTSFFLESPRYWFKEYTFGFDYYGNIYPSPPIDFLDPNGSFEGWECFSVEGSSGKPRWGVDELYRFWPFDDFDANDIRATLAQYGKTEVAIIGWAHGAFPWYIHPSEPCIITAFDVFLGGDTLLDGSESIHDIRITPQSTVSYQSFSVPGEVLSNLPHELAMPRSLDGTAFRISLANRLAPEFGLKDIDFNSTDTRFALYKTGEGAGVEPLFTTPLVSKTTQDIVIPGGVATESGSYKVVVSVRAKASGRIDSKVYSDITIDQREVESFGVTRVRTQHAFSEKSGSLVFPEEIATEYTVSPDSRTTEIFVSGSQNVEQSVLFEADIDSLQYGAEAHLASYIKVWNETVSDPDHSLHIPMNSYRWIYMPREREYYTRILDSTSRDNIVAALNSTGANTAACLPLLPGENMIKYQIAFPGDYKTSVQTLLVWVDDQSPTIEIRLSPARSAGTTTGDIVASIHSLESTVAAPDTLQIGLASSSGELATEFKENREVTLTQNGKYYFYAYDKFHNVGLHKVTVDYIDQVPPILNVIDSSDASRNTFSFVATITDDFSTDECVLYLGFDAAYSAVLGVDPGTFFEIPKEDVWVATGISQNGIYASSATTTEATKTFSVSGTFKYDPGNEDTVVDRTIYLYAVDGAGNQSGLWTVTLNTRNEPAAYLIGELEGGGFAATFSKPVLLSLPSESNQTPYFSHVKPHLPFYSNGTYPITFTDLFGGSHESTIEVDHYDALYNHTVSVSETAPTNQDVQVLINAAFNTEVALELPESIPGAVIEPAYDAMGDAIAARITMTENGIITFGIKPKDTAFPTQTRTIVINNIDRTIPNVSLSWVYTADIVDGQTPGEIIVSLDADKEIVPLENTGTTHTFTLNNQQPYTFKYRDLAGNLGSITATPLVEIVAKDLVEGDTTPPDYTFSIFRGGIKIGGYTREQYEELSNKEEAFPLFSGVLQLRFFITDENQTSMLVQEPSVANAVFVSGTNVTVTNNVDFTLVISDAKGNQTTVPISITGVDNTPPTGYIDFVKTGPYTIRAYLTMVDDRPGEVTLRAASGLPLDTDLGQYYYDFYDNGSFTFHFVDSAGNNGSAIAIVNSLDMSAPVGTIAQWKPYFIDSDGQPHLGHIADNPTNSDVSVYIRFNKPIKSITPSIVNSYGSLDDLSISHTEDSAVVIFRQNAHVDLTYTALNNRVGRTMLGVEIIDKTPPNITAVQSASNAKSVTYTFTSDEPVFLEDGEREDGEGSTVPLTPQTNFTRIFYLNGDYALKFTDMAGNSRIVTVTVSGIDRIPPGLSVSDLPATRESVAAYNAINDPPLEHITTNWDVTFRASIDEAGTISFRGVSTQVSAGQQVTLTIPTNGTYEILASDLAGNITRYQFRVDCIDRAPPRILFPGDILVIGQGMTVDAFETRVLQHASVTDNLDPAPTLRFDEWGRLSADDLDQPGIHPIVLRAEDRAGNLTYGRYYIQVSDGNLPVLRVNGRFVLPGATLFVSGEGSRIVDVSVDDLLTGPGGSEPYSMYWKAGLNTPGQMKNALTFTDRFTAPRDGFYTIYVVTQSRSSIIVYIYLQS